MYNLTEVLNNKRWVKHNRPFDYVTAANVFSEPFYNSLVGAFKSYADLIDDPNSEAPNNDRFTMNKNGYDAYTLNIGQKSNKIFHFFFSEEWHDLLASLYNTDSNGFITLSLHYHKTGSRNGWIHNDLNPGWYIENGKRIKTTSPSECNYKTGDTYTAGAGSTEGVRALTMIFYLNNEQKTLADGGGTAFFTRQDDQIGNAHVVIPPLNNSLVIFPCTPYSYHTFIANKYHPRSSVIMWLHTAKQNVVNRWGDDKIVYWRKSV